MARFKRTSFFRTMASPRLTLALLIIIGVAIAVATFIESARGTDAAKVWVYNARWFEFVLGLFCLNLMFALGRWWPWRPRLTGFVLIHLSVIVILLGAAITRFMGYEGSMFIREGAESNIIYSREIRVWVVVGPRTGYFPVRIHGDGPVGLRQSLEIGGEEFELEVTAYDPAYGAGTGMGEGREALSVIVTDDSGESLKLLALKNLSAPAQGRLGERDVAVGFGSMPMTVPFTLYLEDFVIISYPGSENPVSYESHVLLVDEEKGIAGEDHIIRMNGPLSHRGFKVFQSSYDDDRRGTVLTVNYDPGKNPTYFGYALITLGFILVFAKDLLWPPRRDKEDSA